MNLTLKRLCKFQQKHLLLQSAHLHVKQCEYNSTVTRKVTRNFCYEFRIKYTETQELNRTTTLIPRGTHLLSD